MTNHKAPARHHARYYGAPWLEHGRGPPWVRSRVAFPAVVALIQVVGTSFASHGQPAARPLDAVAVFLLLGGPLALTQRGRWPAQVLVAVFGVTFAYHLAEYPDGPVFVSLVVAFIAAFVHGRRVLTWVMAGLSYFSFLWFGYLIGTAPAPDLGEILGVAAWILVLLAFGEMGRGRQERAIEAARTRREEAKRRASEERLRIAQELHDVLAHNISLMNVQAGVALHLMDENPEQARSALSAIKVASNEALSELRSVLDILRTGPDEPPRSPTPGVEDLDDLVERSRGAGLLVTKTVRGTPRRLPANVDRAAFRISQEALTNVARHAGPARATIVVDYRTEELILEIVDDGHGSAATSQGGGNGIPGMRERASAIGGELEAGPREGGGFGVRARLPIADEEDGAR